MRTVVSYPGVGMFAQQVGLAFHERGELDAFVTSFAYKTDGRLARLLASVPGRPGKLARSTFERRAVTHIPSRFIRTYPYLEMLRTAAWLISRNPVLEDFIWDRMARSFDAMVAKRYARRTEAVYAYEYTAHSTFQRAHAEGVATILDVPSLNNRTVNALLKTEEDRIPDIESSRDTYFKNRFEQRQKRRESEIQLADVIVTNSSVTKRSHVEGGADPKKIIVVPLGAPPPVSALNKPSKPTDPLSVVWAANFKIAKGAHYFLDAWRQLGSKRAARASIYGTVSMPAFFMRSDFSEITFQGHVPRAELLAAFEAADVLVFPSLADGFGMVVTEAFSRGLPVIVSDQAGASDLVRHGENGLIIPAGNAEALRDALLWCMDNRQQLSNMRVAALETAKKWQWSDYRRTLTQALDNALAGSSNRRRIDPATQTVVAP